MTILNSIGLILLPFLFFQSVADENTPVRLHLPSDWKVGEKLRVKRIKSKETNEKGTTTCTGGGYYIAKLEVVEKREKGYVIKWTLTQTELPEEGKEHPVAILMKDLYVGMTFKIETDALGTPIGLVNYSECESFFRGNIDKMLQAGKSGGVSEEEIGKLRKEMESHLTPENINLMALQDPGILLMLTGGTYTLSATREYDTLIPNFVGGDPLPAKRTLLLREIRRDEKEAVFEVRRRLNVEKARTILFKSLCDMAKRMNLAEPTDESFADNFSVEDSTVLVYCTRTGWPKFIISKRSILTGGKRELIKTEFQVTPMDSE